jgi:hypothetical protein
MARPRDRLALQSAPSTARLLAASCVQPGFRANGPSNLRLVSSVYERAADYP